jgi:hypothetical protein
VIAQSRPLPMKDLKPAKSSLTKMSGRIAGYAKTCSGGGHKPSVTVPSATAAFAKDGTAVSLVAMEPASSAKKRQIIAANIRPKGERGRFLHKRQYKTKVATMLLGVLVGYVVRYIAI